MTNFQLRPDRVPEMIELLRRDAPEFFSSRYFQELSPKSATLPGIICGAFTNFLCERLENNSPDTAATSIYFDIIEKWASFGDDAVENWIITEVFENVHLPKLGVEHFKFLLRPKSRSLWDEWLEYPPEDRLAR